MMKRLHIILILAGVVAGCNKNDSDTSADKEFVKATFRTEFIKEEPVKSYLGYIVENKQTILWHDGDSIAVIPTEKSGSVGTITEDRFFKTTSGGEVAEFTGWVKESDLYVGIYPIDRLDYVDGINHLLYKNIYENQIAFIGNLAQNMICAVSVPTSINDRMRFYNTCGLIKFTIPSTLSNITKVAFRGKNGENLAGRIRVNYASTDALDVTFQERYIGQKSSKTLTLSNSDGSALTAGTYYMVSIPSALENGFTVAMYSSDGKRYIQDVDQCVNTNGDQIEIYRSGIFDLGTLSAEEDHAPQDEMYLITETGGDGGNWSYFEPMTKYPIDPFIFRYGGYIKAGQFKFATKQGSWNNNYKALDKDNAESVEYEDATFIEGTDPDQKWYYTNTTGSGKACRIILDITTGVEKMYMNEFTDYEGVWIIGDATSFGWEFSDEAAMTPTGNHTYTWTGDLSVDGELKFTLSMSDKNKNWGGEWLMATEENKIFAAGEQNILYIDLNEYPGIDNKWKVAAGGNYTITLNTLTEKMTIVKN